MTAVDTDGILEVGGNKNEKQKAYRLLLGLPERIKTIFTTVQE